MSTSIQRPSGRLEQGWRFDSGPCRSERDIEIAPPPPRQHLRWRRALRSLRELLADPDSTGKAMDLFQAIGQADFERAFQRFAADPEGRRLLALGSSLPEMLADRARLAQLPKGSLGRSYLDYLDGNGFDPMALMAVQEEVSTRWEVEEGAPPLDRHRAWYRDRALVCHDLDHVLSDYGTDDLGEATLLAFSVAHEGGRANWMLTLGATLQVLSSVGIRYLPYVYQAWRRGRRAQSFRVVPYEDLLALPLATVRALLHVDPVAHAHPAGILRSAPADG